VKELPALDDEFAKDVSEFDTLAEYKNDIKNKMKEDAELRAEHAYEDALVEAIVKNATVEIPEAMIDAEAEDMVAEFEYRLMYQGIKLDDYLGYVGMDKEGLKKEYKAQAEKSVKIRLVMEQIVRTEDLKFSDEEIDAKLSKMAADAGKDLDTYRKALRKEQIDYIVNQILSEKLMALLKKENSAVSKSSAKKATDAVEATEEKPAPKKAPAKKTTKKAE
jgi:trigger factor